MRRAVFVGAAALGLASLVASAVVPVGAQSSGVSAADLLGAAERAADGTTFRGTVIVEWTDGTTTRRQELPVEGDNGRVRVGNTVREQSAGTELFDAGSDWVVSWGGTEERAVPDPTAKYRLSVIGPVDVAGHAAQVVEARTLDGQLRQRTYVDTDTNLVLRRDVVEGARTRSVQFARVDENEAEPQFAHPPIATAGVSTQLRSLPDGMVAPAQVGNGYRLVGRYRAENGTYQLFYSDGLFTVSVFQQDGALDTKALPAGGQRVRVGGTRATQYTTPMGAVLVWQRDGVVFTALGDAPSADVVAVSTTVVRDNRSTLERVVDWLLAPIRF